MLLAHDFIHVCCQHSLAVSQKSKILKPITQANNSHLRSHCQAHDHVHAHGCPDPHNTPHTNTQSKWDVLPHCTRRAETQGAPSGHDSPLSCCHTESKGNSELAPRGSEKSHGEPPPTLGQWCVPEAVKIEQHAPLGLHNCLSN